MAKIDFPTFLKGIDKVYTESINNEEIRTLQFMKLKGNLRISWSFDVNYNKNIDLIFFPEENPYIKYAYLYAKDFAKKTLKAPDKSFYDEVVGANFPSFKVITKMRPRYNINYDFVKKILSQSALSKLQQEKFFEVRFGSVFVPMEIEFEWYAYTPNFTYVTKDESSPITFFYYDRYLNYEPAFNPSICLGVIKSYSVLPINRQLNCDYDEKLAYDFNNDRFITYKDLFTPLPTAALALTQTNIGDYLVNVRDKPDTKEGKIVTQLLSQKFSGNLLLPKFKKLQEENGWGDIVTFGFMDEEMQEHYKTKQAYYEKEKSKLINPLDKYLILVWNIEPNNWAKVWVLKMIRDEDWIMVDRYDSNEKEKKYFRDETENTFYDDNLIAFINGSYSQTFLESPSTLKLHEGYIHCSGLEYFTPFTQNYIKR